MERGREQLFNSIRSYKDTKMTNIKNRIIAYNKLIEHLKEQGLTLGRDVYVMDEKIYRELITGKGTKFIPFKDNKNEEEKDN